MGNRWMVVLAALAFGCGCGGGGGSSDRGEAGIDARVADSGWSNAGHDAGHDAGKIDAGHDAGPKDAGPDSGYDAGPGCECSAADGLCCDGCHFRAVNYVCQYERTGDSCTTSTNLQISRRSWYCTGSSSTCSSAFTGGAVTLNQSCASTGGCWVTGGGGNPDLTSRSHCGDSTDPCDTQLGVWQTDACRLSTP